MSERALCNFAHLLVFDCTVQYLLLSFSQGPGGVVAVLALTLLASYAINIFVLSSRYYKHLCMATNRKALP